MLRVRPFTCSAMEGQSAREWHVDAGFTGASSTDVRRKLQQTLKKSCENSHFIGLNNPSKISTLRVSQVRINSCLHGTVLLEYDPNWVNIRILLRA